MENTDDEKRELCVKLWLEYKDELTRFCQYKLSNHPEEIDDVISDVFYYLCVAVLKNEKIKKPKAWLFAVTNNLIKKKYEELYIKRNRYVSFTDENLNSQSGIDADILEELISDKIIEEVSEEVLSNLTAEERQLYKYIYMENLKMKEIAHLMNLSDVNVRQKKFRMSKKVKNLVKKYVENL